MRVLPISVSYQAYVFLWTIAGGIIIGFIYDIFRITRRVIKFNNLLTYLEDIIYWIIVALVLFYVLYISNEGQLRGFVFIGTLLGAVFYFMVFSPLVMKVSLKIIEIVGKVLGFIFNILFYPVKVLIKIFTPPVKYFSSFISKKANQAYGKARYFVKDRVRSLRKLPKIIHKMRKKV